MPNGWAGSRRLCICVERSLLRCFIEVAGQSSEASSATKARAKARAAEQAPLYESKDSGHGSGSCSAAVRLGYSKPLANTASVGVTLLDGVDGALPPIPLVATTVQVTATPLLRPLTMIGDPGPFALCVPQVAV